MSNQTTNKSPEERGIVHFFTRFGKLFIAFGILIILVVASVIIVSEVGRARKIDSLDAVHALEEHYYDLTITAESLAEIDYSEITLEAQRIIETYPNMYAASRAHFILGLIAETNEEFSEAVDQYISAAEIQLESFLAETAFLRAYQNAEATGEIENAILILQRALTASPEGIQAPRMIFNLGRLSEQAGNIDTAVEHYQRLVLEFPGSSWTNLGRDRIILLNR